jgi:hypothetical protein
MIFIPINTSQTILTNGVSVPTSVSAIFTVANSSSAFSVSSSGSAILTATKVGVFSSLTFSLFASIDSINFNQIATWDAVASGTFNVSLANNFQYYIAATTFTGGTSVSVTATITNDSTVIQPVGSNLTIGGQNFGVAESLAVDSLGGVRLSSQSNSLADALSNGPNIPSGVSGAIIDVIYPFVFNGTTWDRSRSASVGNNIVATGISASAAYGQFNTVLPTITSGNYTSLQTDVNGRLIVSLPSTTITGSVAVTGTITAVTAIINALPAGANTIGKTDTLGNAGAILDGVITAATAPANGLATLGVYQSTVPVLTAGQSVAIQIDTTGSRYVNTEGRKATYRAVVSGSAFIAGASPLFSITGSPSKIVRVTRIRFSASAATGAIADVSVARFSALSGGTSAAVTIGALDTTNPAATAAPKVWTVAATTATLVALLTSERFEIVTASVAVQPGLIEWEFGNLNSQALVLRGTSDFIGIKTSATGTTQVGDIWIEWTEE